MSGIGSLTSVHLDDDPVPAVMRERGGLTWVDIGADSGRSARIVVFGNREQLLAFAAGIVAAVEDGPL